MKLISPAALVFLVSLSVHATSEIETTSKYVSEASTSDAEPTNSSSCESNVLPYDQNVLPVLSTETVLPTESVAPKDLLPTETVLPTESVAPKDLLPTETVLPTESAAPKDVLPTETVLQTESAAPTGMSPCEEVVITKSADDSAPWPYETMNPIEEPADDLYLDACTEDLAPQLDLNPHLEAHQGDALETPLPSEDAVLEPTDFEPFLYSGSVRNIAHGAILWLALAAF